MLFTRKNTDLNDQNTFFGVWFSDCLRRSAENFRVRTRQGEKVNTLLPTLTGSIEVHEYS